MKEPKAKQDRIARNIRAASLMNLPISAVPVSRASIQDGVPLYTLDEGYKHAQRLKPCPIIAKMTDVLQAERYISGKEVSEESKEEITKAVAVSRVIARNTLPSCLKTAAQIRVADFGNMPDSELKKKADAFRDEVLRIKKLQEELAVRIKELPAKSKTLWHHAKEALDIDTAREAYRYDHEEHVLYRIDPNCHTCEAHAKVTEEKRKIDKQLSSIKTA